ncbi:MAG: PucR family transcriptional regulator [Pseudonocardiaceae bacterium]
MTEPSASATLRQILMSLGEDVLEMQIAPAGLDVAVHDVVICDPEDAPDLRAHDLALVVGARGRAAVASLRAAAACGAAAIAAKVDPSQRRGKLADPLLSAASDAGIALLTVPADVRWGQLEALVKGVLASAQVNADADAGEVLGDLFGLASTIATVTGGSVSIEDSASRVLAYSSTGDEVDELRRLSILGRQGPEPYVTMLREWGVYQRLRSGEDVVRIAERPELGIRERLAVGIHAGNRPLGTIWVAEGDEPLAGRAEHALAGAARVAAMHLVRRQHEPDVSLRFRENLLAGLLDGRMDAESVADQIGANPDAPAVVIGFSLAEQHHTDRSQLELLRAEMINLISVHAAAYRRSALVTPLDGRTYVLLPGLGASGGRGQAHRRSVLGFAKDVVMAARRDLRTPAQAAAGSIVDKLADARTSRTESDRVLDAIAGEPDSPVASLEDVRADVLLAETAELLHANPAVRDPRVTALREHDARHGGGLADSLLAYLDALGDVRAASSALGVHPNTVRYRIRRAGEISGIDLADPKQRLFAQIQLSLTAES